MGVILEDIWEELVLANFHPDLNQTEVHCPVIGAQEGFSRSNSFKPRVVTILQDAQPYFLPAGELTCQVVVKDGMDYPRILT